MGIQIYLFLTLTWISYSGQSETIDVSRVTSDRHRIASDVNEFGLKLMTKMMQQNPNENIAVSPTSIAGLLAMTLLGTVGVTYDELASALGFSEDIITNRKNHEQLGELLQILNANDTSSQTLYANAIFIDTQAKLRKMYRDYLKRIYKGDTLSTRFADTVETKDSINEWVKNHTHGIIQDFLKDSLPVTTKVVLLSALYFSGQWAKPFSPEYTMKMSFKTNDSEVMADFMLNFGKFNYTISSNHGIHIVALPYNDSTTTMYVLKPLFPRDLSIPELMDRLDYATINELISNMKEKDCLIRFPKMVLSTKLNLKDYLSELGVKSIFSPEDANFALMLDSNRSIDKGENVSNSVEDQEDLISRINTGDFEARGIKETLNHLQNPGVYVNSVLHDVKITINEFGTEAAAASSGILARTAQLFYANSPFVMFIRNEETKLITFSAVIFNPSIL